MFCLTSTSGMVRSCPFCITNLPINYRSLDITGRSLINQVRVNPGPLRRAVMPGCQGHHRQVGLLPTSRLPISSASPMAQAPLMVAMAKTVSAGIARGP